MNVTDYKLQHYNEQLLPCPFCGKNVYLIPCADMRSDINNGWWEIGGGNGTDCCRCGISMQSAPFSEYDHKRMEEQRDMLIERWNRRVK